MKRPYLVHFLSIFTADFISIKTSAGLKDFEHSAQEALYPKFPIQNFGLLKSHHFHFLFVGLDENGQEIYRKFVESDSFGNSSFKVPLTNITQKITKWQIYENNYFKGIEINMGAYIPISLKIPKKFVICDFDKTLVDTRYSTTKEVYRSLTSPIDSFPTVPKSVELLKSFIKDGFNPFILSASPHFYEDSIRDWLYRNGIYTAGIFLKDYRQVFNPFSGELNPKDLKVHGLYKLNHLLDIVLMAGFPDEITMIGDSHESDPLIYLIFSRLLKSGNDPWTVWNSIKQFPIFKSSRSQNSKILNKIYQIKNLRMRSSSAPDMKIKIHIRKFKENEKLKIPETFEKERENLVIFN